MNTSKKQEKKLTSQIENEAKNKKTFFFALWLLNAATTFVFGMNYIDGLYVGMLQPLRMGDYGTRVFSQILGGLSALLVLDLAYKKWGEIAKTSTTNIQLGAAKLGGAVAFYLSLAFSAIVFVTTAFSGLVSPDLIETLDMVGAASFVGVVILHLVCMATFEKGGATAQEFSDSLKFQADHHTETTAIKRKAQTESLITAREEMAKLQTVIASVQSKALMAEMLTDMLGAGAVNDLIIDGELIPTAAENITPTSVPTSPTTKTMGFGSKAQQPINESEEFTGYDKTCAVCSSGFVSQRRNARYCGESCKQSAYRARSTK